MTKVIAYTYEADTHCVDCTVKRFGTAEDGYVEDAIDAEGNPVTPLFSTDEWWANALYAGKRHEALACGTCGEIIDEVDLGDYGVVA